LGLVVVGFFAAKETAEAFFDLGEGVGCYVLGREKGLVKL